MDTPLIGPKNLTQTLQKAILDNIHNLFISVSAPLFNIQKFVVSKDIYIVTKVFISNKCCSFKLSIQRFLKNS